MITFFQKLIFDLRCECGKVTETVLANLNGMASLTCPRCGTLINLTAEPHKTALDDLRRTASELDKQARQRGKTVERLP